MAIKEVQNEPSTVRQHLYKEFWMQFNRVTASDDRFLTEFKVHQYANVRRYQDYAVGIRAFYLNSSIDFKKKECKIGVCFRNVDIWHNYNNTRTVIEYNIGKTLEWSVFKTKGCAYLVIYLPFLDEKHEWNRAFEVIISNLVILKKEFLKHSHLFRTNWLISSNDDIFDLATCLRENEFVDWQSSFSPNIGDIVYIYRTKPLQRICYKMVVTDINIPYRNTINDSRYWGPNHSPIGTISSEAPYHRLKLLAELNSSNLTIIELRKVGLKHAPQGPNV